MTEIRSLTCDDSLRYCPTKENPADIASRGVSATELVNDEKWWHGPKFLCNPEEEWPTQPSGNSNQQLLDHEVKVTVAVIETTRKMGLEELVQVTKYSSVVTLKRIAAYVLRFVHNVRRRTTRSESRSGELTAEEISEAEQRWIKELQRSATRKEKFKQIKSSLSLFEDTSGILRCCGPLEDSPLPYESKYPLLLPADHHYTKLVIRRCHEEVMHNGVQATLA